MADFEPKDSYGPEHEAAWEEKKRGMARGEDQYFPARCCQTWGDPITDEAEIKRITDELLRAYPPKVSSSPKDSPKESKDHAASRPSSHQRVEILRVSVRQSVLERVASVTKGFSFSHLTLEFASGQIVIGMNAKRSDISGSGMISENHRITLLGDRRSVLSNLRMR
jgi:hypothetical protein